MRGRRAGTADRAGIAVPLAPTFGRTGSGVDGFGFGLVLAGASTGAVSLLLDSGFSCGIT
jgi:hypothetical protein